MLQFATGGQKRPHSNDLMTKGDDPGLWKWVIWALCLGYCHLLLHTAFGYIDGQPFRPPVQSVH